MEEMEVPTEHLHEEIQEKAGESKKSWTLYLAISTAFMAVFAAIGSLLAGHHSNEALIEQIKASDQWSYYQAKGIKYEISQNSLLLHSSLKAEPPAEVKEKADRYKKEQAEIMEKAKEAEKKSEEHLALHTILARAVTLFQVSIALSAIAMLTGRKFIWYVSLVLSTAGIVFFVMGNT